MEQTQSNVNNALLPDDKKKIVFKVGEEEVTLSRSIVRSFLTRGNAAITDSEAVQFISLCKANCFNPFVGDAWLIKYDAHSPAQMVASRDAFMRRAEAAVIVYKGYRSGVIVMREKQVLELEGSFSLPSDQILGAWAEVHRADRSIPIVQKVSLREYNTGKGNWSSKPGTMIQKVAEAQAFRKAFPLNMAGLYIQEELPPAPDEQHQAEAPAETKETPVFQEPAAETIDRPSPEFTGDSEPAAPVDTEEAPAPAESTENEHTLFKI